jgi:hypothetical protein
MQTGAENDERIEYRSTIDQFDVFFHFSVNKAIKRVVLSQEESKRDPGDLDVSIEGF